MGVVARRDLARLAIALPGVPLEEAVEAAELAQTQLMSELSLPGVENLSVGISSRLESGADDAESFVQTLEDAVQQGAEAGQRFVIYHPNAS